METNEFVTIFTTVVSGVLVFVLGQLFNEYFLKPIQDYKVLKAKISYSLTFYANLYMNPITISELNQEYSDASLEIRKLAAEVDATIELRPFGNIFIPRAKILKETSKSLIGISNGFYTNSSFEQIKNNGKCRETVYKKLRIKSHLEKYS